MRTAVTEVRKHGSKKFETLFSSDVSIMEQRSAVRKLRGSSVHETYAEVRYFETPRVTRFTSPAEVKARAEAKAKADAKVKAEAEAKAKADEKAKAPAKLDAAKVTKSAA
jgi:hypothetical protein